MHETFLAQPFTPKMKTMKSIIILAATLFTTSAFAQNKMDIYSTNESPNTISLAKINNGSELKLEMDANTNSIQWQTTNENNTSHFELQVSYDNQDFITAKKIAASEKTAWATTYQANFTKSYISVEKVYYRLKQVFIDGSVQYTNATSFVNRSGKELTYTIVR
jgi:YD repeat-containing protein